MMLVSYKAEPHHILNHHDVCIPGLNFKQDKFLFPFLFPKFHERDFLFYEKYIRNPWYEVKKLRFVLSVIVKLSSRLFNRGHTFLLLLHPNGFCQSFFSKLRKKNDTSKIYMNIPIERTRKNFSLFDRTYPLKYWEVF